MPEGLQLFARDWGAESLLGLLILCIILGLLKPRSSVVENQKILERQIAEAQARERIAVAAAEKFQEVAVVQSRHLAKLSEQSEMTIALLQAIQRAASSQTPDATSLSGRHRGET